MICLLLLLLTLAADVAVVVAADGPVIAAMDEVIFTAPKDKGKAELVEGKVGTAIRFSFLPTRSLNIVSAADHAVA